VFEPPSVRAVFDARINGINRRRCVSYNIPVFEPASVGAVFDARINGINRQRRASYDIPVFEPASVGAVFDARINGINRRRCVSYNIPVFEPASVGASCARPPCLLRYSVGRTGICRGELRSPAVFAMVFSGKERITLTWLIN
jgi:hypothetical protein